MVTRIITGAALIAVLAAALAIGGWGFALMMTAAICLSVFEMFRAIKKAGRYVVEWPVWLCLALTLPLFAMKSGKMALILPLMVGAWMLTVLVSLKQKNPKLEDMLLSALPLVAVVFPGMCMLSFLRAPNRQIELMLIILSFAVPLCGDMAAYFIGRKFGTKKLCETVSPHKTVEGALAGLGGSLISALIIWLIFSCFVTLPPFWHAILLGVVGGIAGQGGDLFASLIKRYCGVKDYGTIFPGHGGMMDRLDSVYWATIVMYIYMAWFM